MPNTPYHKLYTAEKARKARTWRQIRQARRQAEYWRQRWKEHPETMGANLARINGDRRQAAARRTTRLLEVLSHLPERVTSWELRPMVAAALEKVGHVSDHHAIRRFLEACRRRSLIAFDMPTLSWSVARSAPMLDKE